MNFEDHFSRQAQEYARYRPSYPSTLFSYLASVALGHELAWDCGTGNGQAALALVEHFDRVVATDASADQLAHAFPHERVEYRVERAEAVSLGDGSTDLITVAVAVHWFDLEKFYREVRRVLRAGGVLAVWTYHLPAVELGVDQILVKYYSEVLAGYWPERFRYVDECYETLPFPFEELQPPELEMEAEWSLRQVLGFLGSWSAARRYEEEHGHHPLQRVWRELSAVWGEAKQRRTLRWPLYIRIGRVG